MPNNKQKIVRQALAAVRKSLPSAPKGLRVKAMVVVAVGADGKKSRHRVVVGKKDGKLSFTVSKVEAKAAAPAPVK